MAETQSFTSIRLAGDGSDLAGSLRIDESGVTWRSSSGSSKPVEVTKQDLEGLLWTRITKGCQLGLRKADGSRVTFQGFREADLEAMRAAAALLGQEMEERVMCVSGRNWGALEIDGKYVTLKVDSKPLFEIPLPEVTAASQSKDEVLFEFQADDTSGAETQDALVGISFHIPEGYEDFAGEGPDVPAKRFLDMVMQHTEADVGSSADAVASFDEIAISVPRGRFEVQMHMSMIKLLGQTQEYKIKYSSIARIFILPRPNPPQTLVAISLDHPIRKGQTSYNHIICQFPSDQDMSLGLDISDEALSAKNEKCGGYLSREMKGNAHEVFTRCLKGLSGAKVTRAKDFRSHSGDHCIRCSYKANDGFLYPLERAFFFVQKPPILTYHKDIDCVEFLRQGMGVVSGSAKTFDLQIRTKNTPEQQFRGIQRTEWQNLFDFITSKNLKIENLKSAQNGPNARVTSTIGDIDDDIDPGFAAANIDYSDASDSDFKVDSDEDDGGEPSSDGSSSGAEMVAEDDVGDDSGKITLPIKKSGAPPLKKRPADQGPDAPNPVKKSKTKAPTVTGDVDGKKPKKKRKKPKDAPKKALTAFIIYSNENRAKVREENPEVVFGQIQKILGEKWKEVSSEEKARFEEEAKKDKLRYQQEMEAYKAKQKELAEGGGGTNVE